MRRRCRISRPARKTLHIRRSDLGQGTASPAAKSISARARSTEAIRPSAAAVCLVRSEGPVHAASTRPRLPAMVAALASTWGSKTSSVEKAARRVTAVAALAIKVRRRVIGRLSVWHPRVGARSDRHPWSRKPVQVRCRRATVIGSRICVLPKVRSGHGLFNLADARSQGVKIMSDSTSGSDIVAAPIAVREICRG
jgi:hypothetical protein